MFFASGTIKVFYQGLRFTSINKQFIDSFISVEGDRHSPDVVKVDRQFLTLSTFDTGNCLGLKHIANYGIIYFLIVGPPFFTLNIGTITIAAIDLLVGSPSSSLYSHFFVTLDNSSFNIYNKVVKYYWASCWALPKNIGFFLPKLFFKLVKLSGLPFSVISLTAKVS